MPRVLKTSGVTFADNALVIRDLAPEMAPNQEEVTPEEEQQEIEAGFLPDFDTEMPDAPPPQMEDAGAREPGAEAAPAPAQDAPASVPAPDISSEIVQGAMAEAGRILEEAVRKAEQQKAELLGSVQAEAEQLKARAVQEGRAEGLAAAGQEMERISAEIQDAIGRFEGQRAAFETEYENQLKWMSLEIASKVLAKKVSEDDAVLADMVEKAVQSLRSEPWIRVDIAQEMTGLIDALTQMYDQQENVQVSAIPAVPGTVHMETASGVVDVSLRTQLENLREYFSRAEPGLAPSPTGE